MSIKKDHRKDGHFYWSRGSDITPTFEVLLSEIGYIQVMAGRVESLSMYDDQKLLKIRL